VSTPLIPGRIDAEVHIANCCDMLIVQRAVCAESGTFRKRLRLADHLLGVLASTSPVSMLPGVLAFSGTSA